VGEVRLNATNTASRSPGVRLLAVYLNDHLAGSTTVLELVRRASREHADTELGSFFSRLAVEVSEDRQALRRVMALAGARPQWAKIALAWLAEKAGRFKLNGRLLRRSALSPLIELETAETGIYGKMLLWQVLREQRPPGSSAVDLDDLIARAQRQVAGVERRRLGAGAALGM
jgi:hypothetical protein